MSAVVCYNLQMHKNHTSSRGNICIRYQRRFGILPQSFLFHWHRSLTSRANRGCLRSGRWGWFRWRNWAIGIKVRGYASRRAIIYCVRCVYVLGLLRHRISRRWRQWWRCFLFAAYLGRHDCLLQYFFLLLTARLINIRFYNIIQIRFRESRYSLTSNSFSPIWYWRKWCISLWTVLKSCIWLCE